MGSSESDCFVNVTSCVRSFLLMMTCVLHFLHGVRRVREEGGKDGSGRRGGGGR